MIQKSERGHMADALRQLLCCMNNAGRDIFGEDVTSGFVESLEKALDQMGEPKSISVSVTCGLVIDNGDLKPFVHPNPSAGTNNHHSKP